MAPVEVEKLWCSQLEEKVQEVSRSHTKYFYIGYTREVSSYLQRTGPKSEEWRDLKEHFTKIAVCYCWVTDRHLGRFSEQCQNDRYRERPKCLNESPHGEHRPGVVYVVVYKENRVPGRGEALKGGGAARMVPDPWKMNLLRRIQQIKATYQDKII